ncbi:16S rRNA (uracil(1498)-N(3))-methyltransferase [Acinetobacter kookii]|uniref:Ribosomal RNA small subunit methyltransferase E n=1 Tax=Acinetobacter kookii TaxID=1226327 RepID=A0A1G6H3M6_9GAMM|nr:MULTISPECIES: 16S rRNA (uracil(1498)-N(3))-methyltransferase [Acinetobacter]MCT8089909.1 16S rRNA (uracil(1498)-N(3))-methyltransferase [Acinetobacter sp. F_3_1]MCT8098074.1 16S rRNA (uracil(1498)-N(3))-methyltransferase [Acinetobacter sp. C_3_1]MCT8100770.1 16S rRNA (uracil(1498)-N(3))-methyltransferase [Acinetobacter sp. C_4_1]MCT8134523.1 16S rRNA (uracil(1498)-N(3))-methyltransferase [Acinetobacter sp. T_3_1]TCB71395.1 16S rRNA (uracil(1498)-N(3))-methyltransferase [Acinetobacter sp. AN
MPRFYIEADLAVDMHVELTETVFHHWVKVLRAQAGEKATLFNGQGGEYEVTLIEVAKKSARVSVDSFNPDDRTPAFSTLLGQVMSKGDRMDYAIQKATELGVSKIQLLTSERCEMRLKYDRDQKKIDHWQGIAIAACEQCGMNKVPEVLAPVSLQDWLASELPTTKLVLAPNKDQVNVLENVTQDIVLLIGPEGGLSEAEIQLSNNAGFINWCIGNRVLRTETAPIVALSILNYNLTV